MTTDTATPRTDAIELQAIRNGAWRLVVDHARSLELSLRECAELLKAWRKAADDAKDLNFVIVAKRTDALLPRLKGTPNLSALQERDDAQG